jgi:hypothetical protein
LNSVIENADAVPLGMGDVLGIPTSTMGGRKRPCAANSRGTPSKCTAGSQAEELCQSDLEWLPTKEGEDGNGDGGCSLWGFSTGDSDPDKKEMNEVIMVELGQYTFGPHIEGENEFACRYGESN